MVILENGGMLEPRAVLWTHILGECSARKVTLQTCHMRLCAPRALESTRWKVRIADPWLCCEQQRDDGGRDGLLARCRGDAGVAH
jgi:hypothetical protein